MPFKLKLRGPATTLARSLHFSWSTPEYQGHPYGFVPPSASELAESGGAGTRNNVARRGSGGLHVDDGKGADGAILVLRTFINDWFALICMLSLWGYLVVYLFFFSVL